MYKWMVDDAVCMIGLNLADSGQVDKAISHFNQAIKSDANNFKLHFWRGQVHRQAGLENQIKHVNYDRQPNRVEYENTAESIGHFQQSIKDYEKCQDLYDGE